MMVRIQYLLGLTLSLLPLSWLGSAFSSNGLPFPRFYFSGRVAIYRLAQSLRCERSIAILPDYICNVLYRSFIEAGFEIVSYSTTELLEPSIEEIKLLVQEANQPTVLCLAPIMGADGGQSWITSFQGREWRKKNDVTLLFDCCQDITRLFSPCFHTEECFSIISSFNDKSFPGVMGAVAVTDIEDHKFRAATTAEGLKVLRLLFFKVFFSCLYNILKRIIFRNKNSKNCCKRGVPERYEYSYCLTFPYTMSHSGATKIQVGIGVAGMLFHRWYLRRKSAYLELKSNNIIQTPYFLTSSYVLSKNTISKKLKMKLPYAIHGKPEESLRPLLKAKHFKGFMDFYEG